MRAQRAAALAELAAMPHVFVPAHHGTELPPIAQCDDALLPAWSPIRTPDTELTDMFPRRGRAAAARGAAPTA